MIRRTKQILLLTATILAGAGAVAVAQDASGTYDISQLPTIHGKVAQYDLTPRGDVDGLILDDGTEVHFRPDLGLQVVAIVRPGEAVTIHGLKARVLKLVQAMSVTGDTSGKTVTDEGPSVGAGRGAGGHRPPHPPGHEPGDGQPMQAQGVIKMQLHGPRGEMNGVLLADRTMVHLPPPEAARLATQLTAGRSITVHGNGLQNTLGRVVAAEAIGPDDAHLTRIAGPRPRPPHAPDAPGGPVPPPPPADPALDPAPAPVPNDAPNNAQ